EPLRDAELVELLEAVLAAVAAVQVATLARVAGDLPHVVEESRDDELDVVLAAFLLDEALEAVVAFTFGRHRPELADDRDLRLRAQRIDLDRLEELPALPERGEDGRLLVQRGPEDALRLLHHSVGRAGLDLVGTDAIAEGVERVAREQRLHDA